MRGRGYVLVKWFKVSIYIILIYVFTKFSHQQLYTGSSFKDARADKLSKFLQRYNSTINAREYIEAADKYHIDWRLLPAIAGVESTFCRNYIHNCFGWNSDRTPASADHVARKITTLGYYRAWQKDKANIYLLAVPYNYVHPEEWTSKVSFFMGQIQ